MPMDAETRESRITALPAAMTIEEQVSPLAGQDFRTTVPVSRLGIPSIKVSDGPNGACGVTTVQAGFSSEAIAARASLELTGDWAAAPASHPFGHDLAAA